MTPTYFFFFFFNDTATTEIYTLSLHDALPIYKAGLLPFANVVLRTWYADSEPARGVQNSRRRFRVEPRSEEHTSELQSLAYLVCRLLLEKKKKKKKKKKKYHKIINNIEQTIIT